MNLSPIEWTDFTSNPLRYRDPDGNVVHACIHKSAGCLHCYAEVMAKRWGRKGTPFTAENMKRLTPFLDDGELHRMLTHNPAAGKRCFVGDMTDIFGEWVPDELLEELFAVFALRSDVTWQILTKRADRMMQFLRDDSDEGLYRWAMIEGCAQRLYHERTGDDPSMWLAVHGPLPNVWLGVSVEDQKTADERIPLLLKVPAAIRFVSYEPALSAVDFQLFIKDNCIKPSHLKPLDWIIVGGESGPSARPFNIQWTRDLIVQCKAAGVAVFVKQLGAAPFLEYSISYRKETPRVKISIQQLEVDNTISLMDRKGGDMSEWLADLRVREFPREK